MSILLLLLRLLMAPMPIVPAAATETGGAAAAVRPESAPKTGPEALRQAQAQQAAIDAAPVKLRALLRSANDTQYHASCVAQRLAEAQVHVALARDEMRRLTDPAGLSAGDRVHALTRLRLIAERTEELEHAARLCVDDDLSSITATKKETAVSPAIQKRGDVTSPPPLPRPCPGGVSCVVVPEP